MLSPSAAMISASSLILSIDVKIVDPLILHYFDLLSQIQEIGAHHRWSDFDPAHLTFPIHP